MYNDKQGAHSILGHSIAPKRQMPRMVFTERRGSSRDVAHDAGSWVLKISLGLLGHGWHLGLHAEVVANFP